MSSATLEITVPGWVTQTPDCSYNLTLFDGDGDSIQDFNLTREEYVALKAELARLRGYGYGVPAKVPPPELVEKALEARFVTEMAFFASNLEIARTVWRGHRELVEGETFPEDLRKAYVSENGHEPDEHDVVAGEDIFQPGFRETLRDAAYECAQAWMKNGVVPKKA